MKLAIFALRQAASFRNQANLIHKAAIHAGYAVEDRDIVQRVKYREERWDRLIQISPLWPRYVYDSVRLGAPWISRNFTLYGPVDGPYTMNVAFFQVMQNTVREDRVVVPSQFCKEMMARNNIHVGQVVPHGIDPEDFKFGKDPRYDRLKRLREKYPGRTVFFSNLNPLHRKGFDHLTKATEILQKKRPQDWIFILHTGRDKALKHAPGLAKIKNMVIEDAYNVLPFRQTALKTVSCDVFVFPSLLEGFGLPILEAMAARRCIVCLDAPAMNELVSEKEAWLFPMTHVKPETWQAPGCVAQLHEYDPAELARAMEHAMDHPKESQDKAEAAYKRAQQYHYLKVYGPLVKG